MPVMFVRPLELDHPVAPQLGPARRGSEKTNMKVWRYSRDRPRHGATTVGVSMAGTRWTRTRLSSRSGALRVPYPVDRCAGAKRPVDLRFVFRGPFPVLESFRPAPGSTVQLLTLLGTCPRGQKMQTAHHAILVASAGLSKPRGASGDMRVSSAK